MSESRSKRVSKKVNYAAFGGGDDDFDDDFADATPPPSKKAKTSKTSDKPSKGDQNKENMKKTQEKKSTKNRKKPEERVFDKELQAALELSLQESQEQPISVDVSPQTVNITECVIKADTHNERLCTDTAHIHEKTVEDSGQVSEIQENCPAPIVPAIIRTGVNTRDSGDEIQVLNSPAKSAPSKRRAATKAVKPVLDDDGSDYEDDSASDFSESNDSDDDYEGSDFDEEFKSKKAKTVKKENTKKQTVSKAKPVTTKEKSVKAKAPVKKSTPVAKTKPSIVNRSTPSSVVSPRPLGGGLPKWTPPAAAAGPRSPLGGVGIKSPSSGLRIGLSRNQRLKPLHSSVKVQR